MWIYWNHACIVSLYQCDNMASFLRLWAGLSKFGGVGNQKGNINPFLYMLLLSPLSFFLSTFQGEKIYEPSLIPQKTK